MAMPGSGSLGILSCPGSVACTSIAQAVSGNVTPPKSLCALSVSAGKSAPHGMTEFYGYSGSKAVSIAGLSCSENTSCMCKCGCLSYSPARSTNECYFPSYCWFLCKSTSALPVGSCVQMLCNGVSIHCCVIAGKSAYNCVGSWNLDCVDYNDCIDIITLADRGAATVGCYAYAEVLICAITNCVGTYTIGTPSTQQAYSGIIP